MRLELNVSGDSPRGYSPSDAGTIAAYKAPRTHVIDMVLMYAERGLTLYAMYKLTTSEDFKEMLRNRYQ